MGQSTFTTSNEPALGRLDKSTIYVIIESEFFAIWGQEMDAIFHTIRLGNNTVQGLTASVGRVVDSIPSLEELFRGLEIAVEEIEVDLVRRSVRDLGFDHSTQLPELYAAATGTGLELCPEEVGPQLRLKYLDQPEGETLHIGMNPRVVPGFILPFHYRLQHSHEKLWMEWSYEDDYTYYADEIFVFIQPRKVN